MIDWKDVEIDFLFYYFIIMKYLIPIILLLTLTGCSDKSDYIINENIDATNTRIDLVRQAIDRVDNQSTNRYNHLSDEIEIINQQIKNTDETEPQCVPFKVRVGDIVYKDITNDYFSTDDFRKEQ
jgi:hypothetical protein